MKKIGFFSGLLILIQSALLGNNTVIISYYNDYPIASCKINKEIIL